MPEIPKDLVLLAPGVWVEKQLLAGASLAMPPSNLGPSVLPEGHPMWDVASGGDRNVADALWTMADLGEAAITLDGIAGKKAEVFFNHLLLEPGRLFSAADLMEAYPDTFGSASAIAGCLNGFRAHVIRAQRVYPFYWWEGRKDSRTLYAIRPSVAAVFQAAAHGLDTGEPSNKRISPKDGRSS